MRYQFNSLTWNPTASFSRDNNVLVIIFKCKTQSGGQKCMHIPISTPIYWNYGIIHNCIKLPFGKVGFSGSKILLPSRWVCKRHITPPDLQVACLSNGIWLWYSQMSMRLLRARNTCSLSEILAISVQRSPSETFFHKSGRTNHVWKSWAEICRGC